MGVILRKKKDSLMKFGNHKLGIIITIVITATALAFVSSTIAINDNNMQAQGERVLEKTSEEILEAPSIIKEKITEAFEKTDELESAGEVVGEFENAIPDVPPAVKQNKGKLLEMVIIPNETWMRGCEQTNSCFIPDVVVIERGGKIIWENQDFLLHTVTSGSAEGSNVLFDSGTIKSDETFSVKLDLPGEYEYFCKVHPWTSGKIIVQ